MNKSANEMFEEIGYAYDQDNWHPEITYKIKHFISDTTFIYFNLQNKEFSKFTNSDSPFEPSKVESITFDEFKAIQKQIEELGWNEK